MKLHQPAGSTSPPISPLPPRVPTAGELVYGMEVGLYGGRLIPPPTDEA
jgi:hypothetical protein